MDALQQRLEVELVAGRDDDLGVHHAALRQLLLHRGHDLGEVAGHRALVAAAELDLVAVAEHDAAEAVPLRLVEEARAVGHVLHRLGQHRGHRRHHGQVHRLILPGAVTAYRVNSAPSSSSRPARARRAARVFRAGLDPAGAGAGEDRGHGQAELVDQVVADQRGEQARAALAEDRAAPVQPAPTAVIRSSATSDLRAPLQVRAPVGGGTGSGDTTVRAGASVNRLELRSRSRRRETTANVGQLGRPAASRRARRSAANRG